MAHGPDPADNGFSNYDGPITQNIQKLTPNVRAVQAAKARTAAWALKEGTVDVQFPSK